MTKKSFSLPISASCTPLLSLASIEEIAHTTIKMLPRTIYKQIKNIHIKTENFATHKVLRELNVANKYDLLGLYSGIPLHEKNLLEEQLIQDTILLYRGPLIKYTRDSHDSINSVIGNVLIQEVGHHLGLAPHKLRRPFTIK
ncbi:MAG: hypothetical protein COY39_00795 [Alphaproteobacteria bacterium CG_4_10_14_0_8_um_filter_37_21]|nr:MAG: hypothetical protein COY39_00795 [Alphaproteobacteria bacterium CG_4_10_14_0_8_um_filter_37_21]